MIDYIGIERVQELVGGIGPAGFMKKPAGEIEAVFQKVRA